MKERPILFSGAMVRAILDGSKTQTRRVVKGLDPDRLAETMTPAQHARIQRELPEAFGARYFCPFGQPGDRLWVRETWSPTALDGVYQYRASGGLPGTTWKPSIHMPRKACRIELEIVSVRVERLQDISEADADAEGCERLDSERYDRDMTLCPTCGGTRLHRALAPSGGVIEDVDCLGCDTYAKRYRHLWESINGADSWHANPWVWVIEFKRKVAA